MNRVVVVLKNNGAGYFDRLYQHRLYERWLTSRHIQHTFILLDAYEPEIPHAVILGDEDANAFKLRFGL